MGWNTQFPLFLLGTTALMLILPIDLKANEIIESNPFDPGRKPWKQQKEAPPPLPELTPKDLQIEAIISFGQFRGIIAQLDGRLKGTLPANAAGKVRIQVGQNFGGGYTLSSLEPNQVVVQGGEKRFSIPLLRKVNKGGAPAPAMQAQEQVSIAPSAQPVPVAAEAPASAPPPSPPPSSPGTPAISAAGNSPPPPLAPAGNPFAGLPTSSQPESPAEAAAPAQPMSLLDAIRKAQETAKSRANPVQPGIPFTGKQ